MNAHEGLPIFFIGLFDALKYYIISTENHDVVDSFLPEILTFKENFVFSPKNVIFLATNRTIQKISELSL